MPQCLSECLADFPPIDYVVNAVRPSGINAFFLCDFWNVRKTEYRSKAF